MGGVTDGAQNELDRSYVCGASASPLRYETIGAAFDRIAHKRANAEALVVAHQSVRLTWRQLHERVESFAAGLVALGLSPGDRMAVWAPNCVEWVVCALAAAKIGVIVVTLNPAYRAPEFEYAIDLAKCRALVLAEHFRTSDYIAMLLEIVPEFETEAPGITHPRLPSLDIVIRIGQSWGAMLGFDAVADKATQEHRTALQAIARELCPDDPIVIQFTSGTTGEPKGATLTHFNILNNGFLTGEVLGLTPEDRVCVPVPLFHCFGLVCGLLTMVAHGSTMVLPSERFDPEPVLRTVEAERCTALYGVPTMFIAELAHPAFMSFDLRSLRTGIMGGAPCPNEIMRRVIRDMHMADVTIAYGMTETSPVSFQTRPGVDLETRVSTVGTVHPFSEARIVDATNRVLPIGKVGELQVRGYNVMAGYWNDPIRTAETITARGWMHTGDLATLDHQGRCRIVGRSKDMVIRGGENIYPVEIENFLLKHPEIVEAAVFGVSDEFMGEEVCAWIKSKSFITEDAVKEFCRGQLAPYKIPRYIRFVDQFPMTASGKVQKFIARELEAKIIAAAGAANMDRIS